MARVGATGGVGVLRHIVSTPPAAVVQPAIAAGALATASASAPAGSTQGAALAAGVLPSISTVAPTSSATGEATASGALPSASASAPEGVAFGNAAAPTVSGSSLDRVPWYWERKPTSATARGELGTLTASAPEGTATVTSDAVDRWLEAEIAALPPGVWDAEQRRRSRAVGEAHDRRQAAAMVERLNAAITHDAAVERGTPAEALRAVGQLDAALELESGQGEVLADTYADGARRIDVLLGVDAVGDVHVFTTSLVADRVDFVLACALGAMNREERAALERRAEWRTRNRLTRRGGRAA